LLIDAAHNPAGAAALAAYLQDTGRPRLPIVFAAMGDKDVAGMVRALAPVAAAFVVTTVPHDRARGADELAAEVRRWAGSVPVMVEPSSDTAVERALAATGQAVACGSIYLIGPLRARLVAPGAVH
jgi:dihydrofolate synthase / folylpolyglutamate synthase